MSARDNDGRVDVRQSWKRAIERLRLRSPVGRFEAAVWVAVGVSLVADAVLTGYGLQRGLTEGNPLVALLVDRFGFASLVGLKVWAVAVALGVRLGLSDRRGWVVPLGLSLPWTGAAAINVTVLLAG
ncbi:hypothetical protein BRC83_08320 [Halobacteriales archaeon QS_1_68_17]|nr:MAG: hypothetical protein BRC83_08320 [Halobacteriales archaeon QS_1_68_17]